MLVLYLMKNAIYKNPLKNEKMFVKTIDKKSVRIYNNKNEQEFEKGELVMSILKSRNYEKTLNVEVQNGELVIRTPNYLSREDIQHIVNEVKDLITKKQERYIQNEVVKIFGEYCKVKINYKNLKKPKLIVEGKNIKICLPNKYKKLNKEEIVVKLIEKLYMFIAEKEIEAIMEKYRIRLAIAPEDYRIEKMDKMAKCSKENIITINPEIVSYRKEIIEYIVLHQFCHIKYKTHSKGFYNMLRRYMSNYQTYEEEIKNLEY